MKMTQQRLRALLGPFTGGVVGGAAIVAPGAVGEVAAITGTVSGPAGAALSGESIPLDSPRYDERSERRDRRAARRGRRA